MLSVTYKPLVETVFMLNVIMLSVIMLSVVMLNVVILRVVAPLKERTTGLQDTLYRNKEDNIFLINFVNSSLVSYRDEFSEFVCLIEFAKKTNKI
jgi:hypothetical protein